MNYRVNLLYNFDGTSWTEVDISSGIKSLRYQGDCNTSQDMRFGVCLSESVEIEWFNDAVVPVRGNHLKVEIQNSLDNAWTNYGKFKVDRVEKHDITSTVYAYDSTHDLDVDFSARLKELNDNGAFPMSVTDLVLEALETAGLVRTLSIPSMAFAAPVIKAFYSNNITCKDIVLAFSAMTCTIAESSFNARGSQSQTWRDGGDGISFEPYYDMSSYYNIVVSGDYTPGTPVRCKENGIYASEESAPPPNELAIINSVGETLGQRINHPSYQSANVYQITGNILVDNTISTGESYTWNDIASEAYASAVPDDLDITREYQWVPCSLRLDMFPFEFPFKAGDYARFIDASGTRRRVRMMHVTIDESSATISCGGNKSYETSQDQYKTLGEQNTTNMVNIEEIRRIREVVGPYEPYLAAEESHAVGDYFIWMNQLAKCTVAITAGDTIAVGTNVVTTDIVSELGGSSGDWTTLFGSYESTDTAQYAHTAGNTFAWKNQYVKCTSAISIGETIAIGTNVSAYSINKAINDMIPDDALSSTSTHPVQNAIITAALGALIESGGTTANGYFRFENGVQVCFGNYSGSSRPTTEVGNFYILSFNPGITFAKPFIAAPNVIASPQATYSIIAALARNATGITSIDLCRPNSGNLTPRFMWVAVGWWKS